ncbi:ATP-dependent DNA ligase [Paenibacillus nasutitermitis]|uniref:ATP-dependent DNA ligase family profile domain-containing protein n=1 Tax=Paenibacillus nasutitermitis TaxID=1652958 RepID=A0A916ZFJ9_9BACL|nr:DNA ligase [Paenibacillus nasutitermitis]GGD94597.1 hypothetical protein GCM10010911_61580 [Paenibacillus nasutitermitis]
MSEQWIAGPGGSEHRNDGIQGSYHAPLPDLPHHPMAPISNPTLPAGEEWRYQLKWDGVRILARLSDSRGVELYSRNMLKKNATYPEIAGILEDLRKKLGSCLLDGEMIWWDGVRPHFQKVLKRERSTASRSNLHNQTMETQTAAFSIPAEGEGLVYVLFDLLSDSSGDLRHLPCGERYLRLRKLCHGLHPGLLVTDVFTDGKALWEWVEANRWEGIVSKKWSSPYIEGKKHRDWLKKKTALLLDVDIVGLKWRSGIIASLIMSLEASYLGSVSLGLNDALRKTLAEAFLADPSHFNSAACPFPLIPDDLKRERVQWLPHSFKCRVTGLEITSAGQLRHPKLVTFLTGEPSA